MWTEVVVRRADRSQNPAEGMVGRARFAELRLTNVRECFSKPRA
jgi:hypothetical protein